MTPASISWSSSFARRRRPARSGTARFLLRRSIEPCEFGPAKPTQRRSERRAILAKYLLVSFKTCPWVQRAAIVLREKNIDFEFRHIDRDNRPDWFLAISPHKKGPVLRLDDKISLFESSAMSEFLDETTQPQLHPA